jgi:hypothetical protein
MVTRLVREVSPSFIRHGGNMNRHVEVFAGLLFVLIPPYLIELTTEYLYFTPGTDLYFFFSSLRLYFFIIYLGTASFVLGRRSQSLHQVWFEYFCGTLGLFSLLFVLGCNPRVCYVTGTDGLEPFRELSFFLSEGLALSAAGHAWKGLSRAEHALGCAFAFYAIAYYPVAFSLAGVRLVTQFSPFPLLMVVSLLSLVVAARVRSGGESPKVALAVPTLSFLALTGVSVGIASQYLAQVIQLILVQLTCVLVASFVGVVRNQKTLQRFAGSKVLTAALVSLVILLLVVIPPDAVNGTAPNLTDSSYLFKSPVVVAGFNSEPNLGTRGVSANFSFDGTTPSAIQRNNYLAAGIGIHSPNCCVDGLDYGYRADVFLYHDGREVFAASGWEACDIITACGGHAWKQLLYFSSTPINASIASNFRLSMQWVGHTLNWFYSNGRVDDKMAFYRAPRQENPGFDAGWLGIPSKPSAGGYPFFQFGVMSAYPIGGPGWTLVVSCPEIMTGDSWVCLNHVGFIQGDNSYWKFIWRWGENYPGVGSTIYPAEKIIFFQYSQTPIRDFQTAWG